MSILHTNAIDYPAYLPEDRPVCKFFLQDNCHTLVDTNVVVELKFCAFFISLFKLAVEELATVLKTAGSLLPKHGNSIFHTARLSWTLGVTRKIFMDV
jgi:hypothetical protein